MWKKFRSNFGNLQKPLEKMISLNNTSVVPWVIDMWQSRERAAIQDRTRKLKAKPKNDLKSQNQARKLG